MKYTLYSFILVIGVCSASAFAGAGSSAGAEAFFKKYVALGDTYDIRVADLYSDAAVIRTYRRYPHGVERAMELTGAQWKTLVTKVMPLAKLKGDRSTYANIEVAVDGARAKIKADRYSVLKCYTDKGYYMLVEREADGRYVIVEEYTETQPQSNC